MLDKCWVLLYAVGMNNDEFNPVTEVLIASLPYNTEIIFRDQKAYRKAFSSEDLEWRELGEGWNKQIYKASARLAAEYSEAQIWLGEHKNTNHKFVTGDRLDYIKAEADKLAEQAQRLLASSQTQDDLLKAKTHIERAEGMYKALRMVRGYHEEKRNK